MHPDWPKRILSALRVPFEALALLSSAKSFRDNPVIGHPRLNQWGLHVLRKKAAHAVAGIYRRSLAARLPPGQVATFEAQGFLQLDNFLPPDAFKQACDEIRQGLWPLIEMAQPPAVTHRANLDLAFCEGRFPAIARLLQNQNLLDWLRYAAGCPGQPLIALQRITSDSAETTGSDDPQSNWHMDTFHSVGKGWLFLHAVDSDEGPFAYMTGSNQLTNRRLAWERRQSITARDHPDALHARGSFRANAQDLTEMGYSYSDAYVATVNANTLVVADTGGLHRRMPSHQHTVRLEVYLSLRRNPYLAWCLPSLLGLPVLRRHWAGWAYARYQYLLKAGRPQWIPLPAQHLDPAGYAKVQMPARAHCDPSRRDEP
jgi:hypothetical protein